MISVIIPTFNEEKALPATLRALLAQHVRNVVGADHVNPSVRVREGRVAESSLA